MSKMWKVMKRLGMYAKPKNKNESLKQVVSTISSCFDVIRKRSHSKDKNATWREITTALVNKSIIDKRLISNISGYLNVNHKTLERVVKRRVNFECGIVNSLWTCSGRLPRFDMKLTNEVESFVEFFWHDNTRVSPNLRDVLVQEHIAIV